MAKPKPSDFSFLMWLEIVVAAVWLFFYFLEPYSTVCALDPLFATNGTVPCLFTPEYNTRSCSYKIPQDYVSLLGAVAGIAQVTSLLWDLYNNTGQRKDRPMGYLSKRSLTVVTLMVVMIIVCHSSMLVYYYYNGPQFYCSDAASSLCDYVCTTAPTHGIGEAIYYCLCMYNFFTLVAILGMHIDCHDKQKAAADDSALITVQ